MVSAQSTVTGVTHRIYRRLLVDCTEGAQRDSGVPLSCRWCVFILAAQACLREPLVPVNREVSDIVSSVD